MTQPEVGVSSGVIPDIERNPAIRVRSVGLSEFRASLNHPSINDLTIPIRYAYRRGSEPRRECKPARRHRRNKLSVGSSCRSVRNSGSSRHGICPDSLDDAPRRSHGEALGIPPLLPGRSALPTQASAPKMRHEGRPAAHRALCGRILVVSMCCCRLRHRRDARTHPTRPHLGFRAP